VNEDLLEALEWALRRAESRENSLLLGIRDLNALPQPLSPELELKRRNFERVLPVARRNIRALKRLFRLCELMGWMLGTIEDDAEGAAGR
jgi:hypothetical protein